MDLVAPEFLGRLANNLWQIAAAIGYSKKYNVPWYVLPGYHHRAIYDYFPNLPLLKSTRSFHLYDQATPQGFAYNEIPFHSGPLKIRGYWQSVKYFEHCEDEVRSVLKLKEEPIEHIGIHVRRGDYVKHSNSFPPITIEYIKKAIAFFTSDSKFMVVSDDIPWCQKTFKKEMPGVKFEYSSGNPYQDLCTFASCQHQIIANSSFSLFGAWYNTNKNKMVIAPDKNEWFGPGARDINTNDLLPKEWIQISAR